jgi:hypothetical protein
MKRHMILRSIHGDVVGGCHCRRENLALSSAMRLEGDAVVVWRRPCAGLAVVRRSGCNLTYVLEILYLNLGFRMF